MKKRAQAWGFDLIVASIIFIVGIVVFYFYSLNYPNEGIDNLDSLYSEAEFISGTVLSEGYPTDWTGKDLEDIIQIGILTDGKIDIDKVERFYELSNGGKYDETRIMFRTKYDYYIEFSKEISFNGIIIGGESGEVLGNKPVESEAQNLIKINRLVVYDNKPITMRFYLWD